jgi:hypothetical protein
MSPHQQARETDMYAHYFASKNRKTITITRSPSLRGLICKCSTYQLEQVGCDCDVGHHVINTFDVSGKAEARKIADRHSAVCWNF